MSIEVSPMLLGDTSRPPSDPPIAESRQTTALGVFERCSVPVIAVADDGTVLFANAAFAHSFDHSCDALTRMSYQDIRSVLPAGETLFAVTRLGPNTIKNLMLPGKATVFVKMRKSAIRSAADPDAIGMFKELMERLSR
jgi:hypothetical protein